MSFNSIRGSQIREGVITNEHISEDTLIHESKLGIDWQARIAEIFESKLLIDFVQVNGKAVASSSSSIDVTDQISAEPATEDFHKGAVVQEEKNKVIIRDSMTGDPIISNGKEVYGRLTHEDGVYTIYFFSKDNAGGDEPFTFDEASVIDFQFPQRFDLNTISENFASNEKFVDGASDISARLDLIQIIRDAFGTDYVLNQDGSSTKAKSLVDEIAEIESRISDIEASPGGGSSGDGLQRYKHTHRVEDGDPLLGMSTFDLPEGETFIAGNESLDVYFNGMLQMVDVHYTEKPDGTGIDISPESFNKNDVIHLRWEK